MIAQRSKIVATVCTGAALLARTGLLDGIEATSNKISWDWVVSQGSKVLWKRKARWVENIDLEKKTGVITSAGVSAGIDMSLRIVEILFGKDVAERSAKSMEYKWNSDKDDDPFA